MSDNKYIQIRNILVWVLILNWSVAFAKLIYGYVTNSLSMVADGFHSLSDGSSNLIGLIGISVAARPKDAGHPYGHRKYETLASLAIAVILFLIASSIIKESLHRLIHREFLVSRANVLSFVVMGITLTVNIAVMMYEYKKGRKLKSDFLIADAFHTAADIFSSIVVVLSLICIKLNVPIVDVIAGIIISLLICYVGVDILKHSSRILCDYAVIDTQEIKGCLIGIKEIIGCHRIRTRGRSDDIHVDLHITVDKNMTVDKAHELSTTIEKYIRQKFPGTTDVMVHIEPA